LTEYHPFLTLYKNIIAILIDIYRLVLTTELFGFLSYEGVILVEQLLIAKKKKNDPTNVTRR
jgi:hypothetical protein